MSINVVSSVQYTQLAFGPKTLHEVANSGNWELFFFSNQGKPPATRPLQLLHLLLFLLQLHKYQVNEPW